jgi:hypothetical protein
MLTTDVMQYENKDCNTLPRATRERQWLAIQRRDKECTPIVSGESIVKFRTKLSGYTNFEYFPAAQCL